MQYGQSFGRPPLGLPEGSVRALLTVVIVALSIGMTVLGEFLNVMITLTLMVALAHSFKGQGPVGADRPVGMPRHVLLILIALGFVGLGGYMIVTGRSWPAAGMQALWMIGAYALGIGITLALAKWGRPLSGVLPFWEHGKAVVAVLAVLVLAGFKLSHHGADLPHWFDNVTYGLTLFYFGSR